MSFFKDYDLDGNIFGVFIIKLKEEPKPNKDDFERFGWFSKEEIQNMDLVLNCKEKILDYYSSLK